VKVKSAVKTFTYKTSLLESKAAKLADDQLKTELENILTTMEDEEQFNMREEEGSCDEESAACSASSIGFRQQPLTTLKKDCSTTWNSLLYMLESVVKNQELIEGCLSRLRQFDKMQSDEDWKIIGNLVEFLKIFKSATEVLSR